MDILSFFNRWIEKNNDFTNQHIYQCVDIVEEFIHDVLQLSPISGNAIDLWSNADPTLYDKTANDPTNFPQLGDIVIFKPIPPDTLGHCAIATISDPMTLNTFDQNWGTDKKCHVIDHTYTNTLGWLHAKNFSPLSNPTNNNNLCPEYQQKVKTIINETIVNLSELS